MKVTDSSRFQRGGTICILGGKSRLRREPCFAACESYFQELLPRGRIAFQSFLGCGISSSAIVLKHNYNLPMSYKPTIGLEIHTELKTDSKMFCFCRNDPDEKRPNFNVCPICLGHPGTLPVINKEAVRKTIKTGLALHCHIPATSKFDRKNYFYPDLPKGYQISQYDKPFCENGFLEIGDRKIRIKRVHLEEDTGRLLHPAGENYSLVDYNRAGIPLMELVTEPDIASGLEARKFAEELRLILKYLDVSSADMEKGQLRVEVNISISKDNKLGTKVEIKNLNSFRSVEKAIDYEITRQAEALKNKEKIIQETRGWNDARGTTVSQREKEEANDYRYFPEPDLPTLNLDKDFVRQIEVGTPELPQQKRERFKNEFGLDEKSIDVFTDNRDLGEYFEKVISELGTVALAPKLKELTKLTANYLISDVLGMTRGFFTESGFKITAENFAEFITLISAGKITSKTAKQILEEMAGTGADPSRIIEEKNLIQVSDEKEIGDIVKKVIAKNPKPVQDYKSGKQGALQFLVGQVIAQSRGRSNPETVQKLLKEMLS